MKLLLPRQLSRDSVGLLVLRLSAMGLAFIALVLLARMLSADALGTFVWATSIVTVLQIVAVLGFDRLATRELASGLVRDDVGSMAGVLRSGRRVVFLSACTLAILVAGFAYFALEGSERTALLVALVVVPLLSLTTLRQASAQGLGRVVAGRLPEDLLRPALLLAFVAIAGATDAVRITATSALIFQNIAIGIAFVLGVHILARIVPENVAAYAVKRQDGRHWTKKAVPLGFVGSADILLMQSAVIILGAVSGNAEVAFYAVAMRLATFVGLPESVMNSAFMPTIARLHASREHAQLALTASQVSFASTVAGIAFALPVLIAPEFFLSVFDSSLEGGSGTLRLLCIAWIISAFAGTNGSLLMMSGRPKPVVAGIVLALFVNCSLAFLLAPGMGATGAGWAWLATSIVWNAFLAIQARRELGFWATPLLLFRASAAKATS